MASPRPSSRFLRICAIVGVTVGAVGLSPGRGDALPAAPTTCEASRAQFTSTARQAETVAEDFNDAKLLRQKAQKQYAVAAAKAKTIEAQYQGLAVEFKRIIASEMKSTPASHVTTVFSGGGPREFLDQLSLMDYVAGKKQQKIKQVAAVRQTVTRAKAAVRAQLIQRQQAEKTMNGKWTELRNRSATLKALRTRLCAQPNGATVATGDTIERGSRGADRSPVTLGGSPSAAARTAVQTALAQRGKPYVYGAGGSATFDCSGLTAYAYRAAGIGLPHSSRTQSTMGTYVPRGQVQAGDLVFFYDPVSHVGIAISNTQMVDASTEGVPVQIHSIDGNGSYNTARRVG